LKPCSKDGQFLWDLPGIFLQTMLAMSVGTRHRKVDGFADYPRSSVYPFGFMSIISV